MFNDILWPDHIQWQPPTDQTLYWTGPFTEFWEVSIEHLRRVWHADRGRLLLRTPGPVPLGLAYDLLVETNPFSELVVIFPDYALRISLGTFSILLSIILWHIPVWEAYLEVAMHGSLNKTFSRGASPGISQEMRNKNTIGRQWWYFSTPKRKV